MPNEVKTLIGPFPSRQVNTCTQCAFTVHRFAPIYFYKNRRTQQEIASGVKAKGPIVLHKDCLNAFQEAKRYSETWEVKAPNGSRDNDVEDTNDIEASTPVITPVVPTPMTPANGDLLTLIAGAVLPLVQSQLQTKVDTKDVASIAQNVVDKAIKDVLAKLNPTTRIEICDIAKNEVKDLGLQHKQFPQLWRKINARMKNGNRLNIWVAGPAGTGKTSAAEAVAKGMGVDWAFTGSLSEEYKVLGFISPATGQAVLTAFHRIWEFGGVFCFDDFDGSDPIAALGLNGPLAGSWCCFPDGRMVKRHPDCVIILTANTWGQGATSEYVGRVRQDAAFLNRFVKLYWDIDESLELATCGSTEQAVKWCKRVQLLRSRVKAKGLKVLVTPRATYYGVALLEAGDSWEEVEQAVIASEMSKDQWEGVR